MDCAESLIALHYQLARLEELDIGDGVAGAKRFQHFLHAVAGPEPRNDVADAGHLGQIDPFDVGGEQTPRPRRCHRGRGRRTTGRRPVRC